MPGFRERLEFDTARGEIRDGEVRYLLIRPDGLMGLFRRLDPAARLAALEAFADSIREHGGRSAEKYRAMGAADQQALLAVITETAPQLGWGAWRFDGLALEVTNSPFAAGHGAAEAPVCAPIAGMFGAVATLARGRPAAVRETACAAQGARCCRFAVID